MAKNKTITVKGTDIVILSENNNKDYISPTGIAGFSIIEN